ncbi:MAG: UDP-2,3-diacylglucosamine diphosphatase LpxI [Bdellovibrionales bacterium]|nr:UDP-2,3-diacylglucosamine diphosphatase LpxI [Bdellovibrionales bacterium]
MAQSLDSNLGLIAGNGNFPLQFARNARAKNFSVFAVAHQGETEPALEEEVSACCWIKVGQLRRLVRFFLKSGVRQVAFAGGIGKPRALRDLRPDSLGLKVLAQARSSNDDALLRAVATELEKQGLEVISATELVPECLPQVGCLTKRRPNEQELRDAVIGWQAAKAIGASDIGQTVCVWRESIIAVEAIEGTDATIERAFKLAGSAGVVIKLPKPQQDERFDLPAIGIRSIEVMQRCKASALVLEAQKAVLLDPQSVISAANSANISIIAVDSFEGFGAKL